MAASIGLFGKWPHACVCVSRQPAPSGQPLAAPVATYCFTLDGAIHAAAVHAALPLWPVAVVTAAGAPSREHRVRQRKRPSGRGVTTAGRGPGMLPLPLVRQKREKALEEEVRERKYPREGKSDEIRRDTRNGQRGRSTDESAGNRPLPGHWGSPALTRNNSNSQILARSDPEVRSALQDSHTEGALHSSLTLRFVGPATLLKAGLSVHKPSYISEENMKFTEDNL